MTSPPPVSASAGRRRGFAANVMIISGGSVLGQAIAVLTAPIVARLFAPEAFGIGAIFGTICAVVTGVGCLRYDYAVLLPKSPADGAAVLSVSLGSALAVTALSALAMLVAGEPLLRSLGAEELLPYAWVVPAGILLHSLELPLAFYYQRRERFATVAVVRLVGQTLSIVAVILVGWLGLQSGRDLVFARTSMLTVLPLCLLLLIALRPVDVAWIWPGLRRMRSVAWRYREFPLLNSWSAILDQMALQSPPLVMAALFSPGVVGLYALARRLVGLPAQFASQAVAQVFFQRASAERARGDMEAFARTVQQVAERLTALGTVPLLLVALLGPTLVAIVFGDRWSDAGVYAALVVPVTFAMFVASPMTILVSVLEMHRFNVVMQGALLVLGVGSLWLGSRLVDDPRAALAVYGVTVPVALMVQQTVLLRASGARPAAFFAHLGRHLAYATPCPGAWLAAEWLLGLPYPVVFLVTVAGAVPYVYWAAREDPSLPDAARQLLAAVRGRVG